MLFYIDQERDYIHKTGLDMCTLTLDLPSFENLMFSYSFAPQPDDTKGVEALRPGLQKIFFDHQKGNIVKSHFKAELLLAS